MSDSAVLDLLTSSALFRLLADQTPIMLWVADAEGSFLFVNQAWLTYRGRALEQELGCGWSSGVHEDERRACLAAYHAAVQDARPSTLEYRLRRHDGVYRRLSSNGVPWFD